MPASLYRPLHCQDQKSSPCLAVGSKRAGLALRERPQVRDIGLAPAVERIERAAEMSHHAFDIGAPALASLDLAGGDASVAQSREQRRCVEADGIFATM